MVEARAPGFHLSGFDHFVAEFARIEEHRHGHRCETVEFDERGRGGRVASVPRFVVVLAIRDARRRLDFAIGADEAVSRAVRSIGQERT
jgi:hypothetical protein